MGLRTWKQRAKQLRTDIRTLALAARDPRVPLLLKLFILALVGYALSPIDLIPDFIPVLGYLDDLILLPLGILLAIRMIDPALLAELREKAAGSPPPSGGRAGAWIIGGLWAAGIAVILLIVLR